MTLSPQLHSCLTSMSNSSTVRGSRRYSYGMRAANSRPILVPRVLLLVHLIVVSILLSCSAFVPVPYGSENRERTRLLVSVEAPLTDMQVDNRPYEQRADGPRLARRMNHGFKYLYRHDIPESIANISTFDYLHQYFSKEEVKQMNQSFPPLLELNVKRHLHPKMRFLRETLELDSTNSSKLMELIPPQYFGARLERIIAPRHAFLVYKGLPHGQDLLTNQNDGDSRLVSPTRWQDFMVACRTTKRFCALCNQWRSPAEKLITSKEIEAFDFLFGRGLMAAARNELCQSNNTWPLEYINITAGELIELLIQHGANPRELDNRGVSLLHWAAGSGNEDAVRALLPHSEVGLLEQAKRDGATPLHWAAAGANSREFGTGGHPHICQLLLSLCDSGSMRSNATTKDLVNQVTHDGNSPLMWAAWSGTLDTVKLLVRTRADVRVKNRNGCSVAHWAASGGSLEVCKYLHDVVNVDFFEPNHGGNTPLTHSVAFGRASVVEWLRKISIEDDDEVAAALAQDFFLWTDGDPRRKQVMQLFEPNFWTEETIAKEDDEVDYGY